MFKKHYSRRGFLKDSALVGIGLALSGSIPISVKTGRMFYSDAEIAVARANVAICSGAKKMSDKIIKEADYWIDWKDHDILDIMASAKVPRAFDVNAKGSPIHGSQVFTVGGAYPWIVDPKHPFQVKSPIDGQLFPSNDYATYYKSGFKDKKDWDTGYLDDGWGWIAPDGERYWFVAYANHWIWYRHIIPGILQLARAYQLTGDHRYAHKAALMLHRLSEVYPSMNYADQSRYGLMMQAQKNIYPGKIVNRIWETSVVQDAAEAYDAVWESIDGNDALQRYLGKSGQQIRAYIEANFLEEALRAFAQHKLLGNFGMHQRAVMAVTLARQYADPEKYVDRIVNEPGADRNTMGIRYALYNQVFRDGFPLESPGYNFLWIWHITLLSNLLQKPGINLLEVPRMKRLLNAPIQTLAIGRYTPALGDGGTVIGEVTGRSAEVYQTAFAGLGDPTYIAWLSLPQDQYFTTYESLFRKFVDIPGLASENRLLPPQKSRLFAGYGFGILNNKRDASALAIKYGVHYAHAHWDFLNVELFANGQKMIPDLGYPDAMNTFVREVYTWSTNTVSHNTVVVDEQRQNVNGPGTLHHFSEGAFVQSLDVQSPAYRQVRQYRRNLIQVELDDEQTYVVDFFHVQGGKQHDYVLHGPPGEVALTKNSWSAVQPGTFAGPNVSLGTIYDNADPESKGDSIGYNGYGGSGYQHLFNVQKLEQGEAYLAYQHINDPQARLKLHVMSHDGQQVFIADAYNKPRAKDHVLKYMITRRKSHGEEPLHSTFVGIFETYREQPYIRSAESVTLASGNDAALAVNHKQQVDVIVRDTTHSVKMLAQYGTETDANTAVVTFDKGNIVQRVYFTDGTYLRVGKETYRSAPIRGTVRKVDIVRNEILIDILSGDLKGGAVGMGGVFHFANPYRITAHPATVVTATGNTLRLALHNDVLVGYFGVAGVQGRSVRSDMELNFFDHYTGSTLLDSTYALLGQLVTADRRRIQLENSLSKQLQAKDKVWLADIGVGDTFTWKTVFSWQKVKDGTSTSLGKNMNIKNINTKNEIDKN